MFLLDDLREELEPNEFLDGRSDVGWVSISAVVSRCWATGRPSWNRPPQLHASFFLCAHIAEAKLTSLFIVSYFQAAAGPCRVFPNE